MRTRSDQNAAQRRGLLAKVHIAVKELGIADWDYRALLAREFRVMTAAKLSVPQLEELVRIFRGYGWKASRSGGRSHNRQSSIVNRQSQVEALQRRVVEAAEGFEPLRLRGLCRSICQVDDAGWCKDVRKLKRLVAVIGKIRREEGRE